MLASGASMYCPWMLHVHSGSAHEPRVQLKLSQHAAFINHLSIRMRTQIRSHAQKYFQKVLKQGDADTIPPPRHKRRSAATVAGGTAPASTATTSAGGLQTHVSGSDGSGQVVAGSYGAGTASCGRAPCHSSHEGGGVSPGAHQQGPRQA